MKSFPHLFTSLLLAGACAGANADPIHALGDQAPAGFGTNSAFSGNARGWGFTAGAADINVSQLGIAPASGGSYTLSLWEAASKSVLAQATLPSVAPGAWNWANLSSSVTLTAGQGYVVTGYGNDASQSYFFGTGLASWRPTGAINYVNMKYCNSCTANTFPSLSLSGAQYGLVDIGYTIGRAAPAAVPEPSTLAILALGLVGFGASRRRKSR